MYNIEIKEEKTAHAHTHTHVYKHIYTLPPSPLNALFSKATRSNYKSISRWQHKRIWDISMTSIRVVLLYTLSLRRMMSQVTSAVVIMCAAAERLTRVDVSLITARHLKVKRISFLCRLNSYDMYLCRLFHDIWVIHIIYHVSNTHTYISCRT